MANEPEGTDKPAEPRWPFGEEPACDEGLLLLEEFGRKYPTLFELALRHNFTDPTHPGVLRNPLWIAFAQHYTACSKCNEV